MNCPRTWAESDEARRLLAQIDHAERLSDRYGGYGWNAVSRGFAYQVDEWMNGLEDIRAEAVGAFADARAPRDTEAHDEAWCEADDEAESVEDAVARARRLRLGDGLLEVA